MRLRSSRLRFLGKFKLLENLNDSIDRLTQLAVLGDGDDSETPYFTRWRPRLKLQAYAKHGSQSPLARAIAALACPNAFREERDAHFEMAVILCDQ